MEKFKAKKHELEKLADEWLVREAEKRQGERVVLHIQVLPAVSTEISLITVGADLPPGLEERCALRIESLRLQTALFNRVKCFVTLGMLARLSTDELYQFGTRVGGKTIKEVGSLIRNAGLVAQRNLTMSEKEREVILSEETDNVFEYPFSWLGEKWPTIRNLTNATVQQVAQVGRGEQRFYSALTDGFTTEILSRLKLFGLGLRKE